MTELLLFVVFIVIPWMVFRPLPDSGGAPAEAPPESPAWVHGWPAFPATDPTDDYRAGYIDKYTYAARMTALKRYITAAEINSWRTP